MQAKNINNLSSEFATFSEWRHQFHRVTVRLESDIFSNSVTILFLFID